MSSSTRTTEPASAVLPALRPTRRDECSRCSTFSPAVGVVGVLRSGRSDRRAAVSRFNVHLLGARDGMPSAVCTSLGLLISLRLFFNGVVSLRLSFKGSCMVWITALYQTCLACFLPSCGVSYCLDIVLHRADNFNFNEV